MDWMVVFNVIKDIFNIAMMIANISIFLLSFIWNVRFLKITEKQEYSWIKRDAAIVSFAFVVAFSVLLISEIVGKPILMTLYGVIALRPLIFLMGCVMAASARARLIALKNGGEKWMLRKFKT